MFRAFLCALLGSMMLCATSVNAREALISIEGRIGGDDNIFRQSDDKIDDGSSRLRHASDCARGAKS